MVVQFLQHPLTIHALLLGVVQDVDLPEGEQKFADNRVGHDCQCCATGLAWRGWTAVPGRSSSVPCPAISSPALRSPNTSINRPVVSPVRTSTHSVLPPRTRVTNVRSVVDATLLLGTNN